MAAHPRLVTSCLRSLLLTLSHLIFSAHFSAAQIPGVLNLTSIDLGDKNPGVVLSSDAYVGAVGLGSTGSKKGSHLGSAAQAILETNNPNSNSSAQVLLQNTNSPAFSNQSLLSQTETGQSLWSESLYPYLQYFNGTVMSQLSKKKPFTVYLIYYGTKWTEKEKTVIKTFIESLNPTVKSASEDDRTIENWWKITTRYYYDSQGRNVTSDVRLGGAYEDSGSAYPFGSIEQPLTDRKIREIVAEAVATSWGLANTRSVYVVLTDRDTYVQDFCSSMCTYHSSFRTNNRTAAYIVVGNPETQCPNECTYLYFGPSYKAANGLGVDGAVNWLAHGLTGVATNAFQARTGYPGWVVANTSIENADLCEWDFGYYGFTKDYATYNLVGNNDTRFLIQRNWNRGLQRCTILGNGKPDEQMSSTPT